jgi:hypothetical protein
MEEKTFMSGLSIEQQLRMVAVDLVVLLELFVSMWFASRHPEQLTGMFFKSFLAMLAPTIVAGYYIVRGSRARKSETGA